MSKIDYVNELVKSEDKFSFELKGDECIDATELSLILQNTVEIVNNLVQGKEDTYVNLKVTKFSTGSFDIDFKAVCEQINNIITCPEAMATLIVSGVTGVFNIAKHLKGKKPKSIKDKNGFSEIENDEGDIYKVDGEIKNRFFKDAKIENSVINIVNIVDKNEREGFSIKGNNETVDYGKDDFSNVKPVVKNMLDENENRLVNKLEATLIIRKPDLVGKSKWGFIFDKNIEASIEDEEWLDKIHEEKSKFCMGMKLPVLLKIETILDDKQNVVGEPIYSVLKVTGEIIEENDNQIDMNI